MNRNDQSPRPALQALKTRGQMGDLLREGREQAQLSPEAAAELLEIETQELLDAEAGRQEIPLQRIFAAANIYNIDPAVILDVISDIKLTDAQSSDELERISKIKI